jgi:alpha-L-fucosidase 2
VAYGNSLEIVSLARLSAPGSLPSLKPVVLERSKGMSPYPLVPLYPMVRSLTVVFLLSLSVSLRAELQTDVEYGRVAGECLKLDAWVPDGQGPFPAVILVHGGGWTAGDKSGGPKKALIAPMQEPLQRAGFAWFSINYRLAPKFPYPACIEDVERAIRWVKAHAAEYQIDPQRIALAGESAGGHLVALAATRADASTRLAAIVPFYAPVDLGAMVLPGAKAKTNFVALFGAEAAVDPKNSVLREASPLWHVKRGLPPFLLVHGTADASVPYDQSVRMQARLQEAGVACDLITIKDGAHGMLSWTKIAPDYQDRVVEWLTKTLGQSAKKTRR